MRSLLATIAIASSLFAAKTLHAAEPPQPYGVTPSPQQLAWHQLEFYGFCHFTVDTFTDREWGLGSESESVFNPTQFDAEQIVKAFKSAGMKGVIITAKHHDGFCLWPTKYTEHSVKNAPWENGKGDFVRDMSDACRRNGMKFGVYLSPWDRNSALYGKPEYITYYRNQLRELLTQYGPIFEVWLDGANGGDGYYGGANEKRTIDKTTYYDWPNTWNLIHELQPNAVIFSDVGPGCRWVGNESGIAGETCWATINTGGWCPGNADEAILNSGLRHGTNWIPAEADVSIRPGWFWHEKENTKVRSAADLWDHYLKTVGRGSSLILNVPPDSRGIVSENDVKSLADFGHILKDTFAQNLAATANITASNIRGGDSQFAPQNLLDDKVGTYWATDDTVTNPVVTFEFKEPVTFNLVNLREYLPLGQRIEAFALDQWQNDQWIEFAHGTSIGSRRLCRSEAPITTAKVRLRITQSPVCPALAEFGLYQEATAK